MFNIIKIPENASEKLKSLNFDNIRTQNIVVEYLNDVDVTLIYCFFSYKSYSQSLLNILKQTFNEVYLLPITYHNAYKKPFYYTANEDIFVSNLDGEVKLFQNYFMLSDSFTIFLEFKARKLRFKDKLEFHNIEELKRILCNYEIKYLIPFFYSIREMKEFHLEDKKKVSDLSILYLIENKTFEGKKR